MKILKTDTGNQDELKEGMTNFQEKHLEMEPEMKLVHKINKKNMCSWIE